MILDSIIIQQTLRKRFQYVDTLTRQSLAKR